MTALDTGVVVAAFASWHQADDMTAAVVRDGAMVPAPLLTETCAVLTRTPEPFGIAPAVAAEYLSRQWHGRILVPSASLL